MAFVGKLKTMECHINTDLILPVAFGGKLKTMSATSIVFYVLDHKWWNIKALSKNCYSSQQTL